MSMDTTFPGNKVMYRAVTNPEAWQIVYALITATETICGVLFLGGALQMWQARYASAAEFQQAKAWPSPARRSPSCCGSLVFMVIAGEWFAMWQSKTWNAQHAAFRIYITVLAVLIFVSLCRTARAR